MHKFTSLVFPLMIALTGCSLQGSDAQNSGVPTERLVDGRADVMVFTSKGVWKDEVSSLRKILFDNGVGYKTVTSEEMNEMSAAEMSHFKLVIIPGGDSDIMSATLHTLAGEHLREAVKVNGLSYLGFCAGAFMAVAPKPEPGLDPQYGLGVLEGPVLKVTPDFPRLGRDKIGMWYALPLVTFPDGLKRRMLWYGGPITPEIPGGVLARFADGNPAVTQAMSGKGMVTIAAIHPTANKEILGPIKLFVKEAIDPEYTWQLIKSGINKVPLPAMPPKEQKL